MMIEATSILDAAIEQVRARNQAIAIPMSRAEFLALPEMNVPIEYIDGATIVSPSPIDFHQEQVYEAAALIKSLFPNGKTRIAPLDVHIDGFNTPQPDVFWVSAANTGCRLGDDGYWYGAPDLIVEVLSPSTERRDRGDKFDIYQAAGVREDWLVGSDYVEVYHAVAGKFARIGVFGTGEAFPTALIEAMTIPADRLFAS
ncbi:MAG: Uma2 family endonuclease [Chloroflexota bacterium]|nr:Uma2 family endonuclease [Chloroflexota bacterium]